MSRLALRPVDASDLDAIFEQMRDPESVRLAAFTAEDPNDRGAFDAHMAEVMSSSENRLRAIIRDARLVGTISSYPSEGATEVTYWIDRGCWGQGIATRALGLLLEEISVRPIRARAASDNAGSLRVLQKAGFHPIGTELSFARGPGRRDRGDHPRAALNALGHAPRARSAHAPIGRGRGMRAPGTTRGACGPSAGRRRCSRRRSRGARRAGRGARSAGARSPRGARPPRGVGRGCRARRAECRRSPS